MCVYYIVLVEVRIDEGAFKLTSRKKRILRYAISISVKVSTSKEERHGR